jgi:hypothetical protein
MKALVSMIARHLATVHTLLRVLVKPTPEMQQLRLLLVYQLALPYRFEHGLDVNVGLKPFQQAA